MTEPKDPSKRMIYTISMIGALFFLVAGPVGCEYVQTHKWKYDWANLWMLVSGVGGLWLAVKCYDYGEKYGESGGIMRVITEALLPICLCFFLFLISYDSFENLFKKPSGLGKSEHWCHVCERTLKIGGKDYRYSRYKGSDGDAVEEVICEKCGVSTNSAFDFVWFGIVMGGCGLYASSKTYSHIKKTWLKNGDDSIEDTLG